MQINTNMYKTSVFLFHIPLPYKLLKDTMDGNEMKH